MTAAAAQDPVPEVAKTPEAIRAALLPEERDRFDESCRWALDRAAAGPVRTWDELKVRRGL